MYVCLCVCSLSVYFLESFLNFLIHLAEFLCSVPSPKTTHSQSIMHMSVKYPYKIPIRDRCRLQWSFVILWHVVMLWTTQTECKAHFTLISIQSNAFPFEFLHVSFGYWWQKHIKQKYINLNLERHVRQSVSRSVDQLVGSNTFTVLLEHLLQWILRMFRLVPWINYMVYL